ncbi:MAG: hypothetical protein U0Z44_03075 [Kouleothrix sp.]
MSAGLGSAAITAGTRLEDDEFWLPPNEAISAAAERRAHALPRALLEHMPASTAAIGVRRPGLAQRQPMMICSST